MCINCYRKNGREKKAWKCCHPERAHYARGMCQNCYLNLYHNVSDLSLNIGAIT